MKTRREEKNHYVDESEQIHNLKFTKVLSFRGR